jgi:hypothetical protein
LKVKQDIDSLLLESGKVYEQTVGAGGVGLGAELWQAVDEVIGLVDCDVYTYRAVAEGDPFTDEANLWSFNYFFYSKKLKRILYFSCRAVSKTAEEDSDDGIRRSLQRHGGLLRRRHGHGRGDVLRRFRLVSNNCINKRIEM